MVLTMTAARNAGYKYGVGGLCAGNPPLLQNANPAAGRQSISQQGKDFLQKSNSKTQKTTEAETSEKSTASKVTSCAAKQVLNVVSTNTCSIISKFTKTNPVVFMATLIGVELEEAGNAFKEGAIKNEGGNFSAGYAKCFEKMKKNAKESKMKALGEVLNFVPNVVSVGLTNGLKYAGCGAAKVVGKETAAFIGSCISAVGNVFNTVGSAVGTAANALLKTGKNLISDGKTRFKRVAAETRQNYKNVFGSLKNKVSEVGKDCKELVSATVKKFCGLFED